MTDPDDEILFERRGGIGLITLNRPKALNAFTLHMYTLIAPVLATWDADPEIHAIVVRGAGGKAFSAGGDIRALWETGPGIDGPDDLKRVFFRDEYRVVRQVHRLSKPYIALMNGITMGGGVGMSINGSARVATETTIFAMPETAIGMVPDVGASRFLPACPGKIGLYLGLTGARLKAADLIHTGLATHFVPSERLDELIGALAGADGNSLAAVLDVFAADPGPAPLRDLQDTIDRCFGRESVEAILSALENEATEWSAKTLDTLQRFSPTSLAMTFRQLGTAHDLSVEQALALEFKLVTRIVMTTPDFFEGVRAVLVDKDQSPKWHPATLGGVDGALIDRVFADADDLDFED